MTRTTLRALLFCLAAVFLMDAGPVTARCNLEAEIQRAGEMLDRAREIVEKSGLPEARELLRAASVRRNEAVEKAKRGELEFACRLARVSQSLSGKAAEIARRGIRGLEELEFMLRKTNELLRETRTVVTESGSDEARKFLGAAGERQQEAWNAFRGRRTRMAIKLTLMARDAAERARRMAEGRGDASQVDREIMRTDRLLEEATRVLAQDRSQDGEGALGGARRLQRQAKRHREQGHPELARGLTMQSRQMIRRALGRADKKPAGRDVEAMIRTTSDLVARLEPAVAQSKNDRAWRLLEKAKNLLGDARDSLAEGRVRKALGSARSASALALDVSDMLERGGEE